MRASNRTKSPISTLCKIANTTNNKRASQRLCKHPTRLPSCCSRAFSQRTPTRKAVSRAKGTFIFLLCACSAMLRQKARPAAARSYAVVLLGSLPLPKPHGCSFFIKQNPDPQKPTLRFTL